MTITAIVPVLAVTGPVCFGVCCPRHSHCRRYLAVDHAPATALRIGTCESAGTWPQYQPAAPWPAEPLVRVHVVMAQEAAAC